MRLSITLDDDLYAIAKSLARDEDTSISAALNTLIRRGVTRPVEQSRVDDAGFPVSRGRRVFTSEDVRAAEEQEDYEKIGRFVRGAQKPRGTGR